MHVCFLCTEIFRWGKYGGFGRATRIIGRELAKRGVRVSAVIPLPRGHRVPVREEFDGLSVIGYPPTDIWSSQDLYRQVDADVYHTEQPFIGTYLARRAMPQKAHVVTFRDPRLIHDWWIEFKHPTRSRLQVATTYLYYDNPWVREAVRQAHGWGVAAAFLVPKARAKYGLRVDPIVLPSLVHVPDRVKKADRPTVSFIGRFDRVKRPEVFFALAMRHPEVDFIAVGESQDDGYAADLFARWPDAGNLQLTGFIDQFASDDLSTILSDTWILANTSAKEALPNAFIEAAAHQCAILSEFDPDGMTSRFGCLVSDGDYSRGLEYLLKHDRWRDRGRAGQVYARENFATDMVIDQHLDLYERAIRAAAA